MGLSVGIVGVGNMGGAIARGLLEDDTNLECLYLYDHDPDSLTDLSQRKPVQLVDSLGQLEVEADRLVLAVKPGDVPGVLKEFSDPVVLGSVAAGVTLDQLSNHLSAGSTVVRAMPNTPAQVGEGVTFMSANEAAGEEVLVDYERIFGAVGEVHRVREKKMDAVTALTGSGPAYVLYFMEALEEAGIHQGLSAEVTTSSVKQLLQGVVALMDEEQLSVSELRRAVCSPGGTTVQALKHLRESGWSGDLMEAVNRAAKRSRELGQ